MLGWVLNCGLEIEELVLCVGWDEAEGCGGREGFAIMGKEGGKRWRVKRVWEGEDLGANVDVWEREWGYLVDMGMSW